MNLEPSFVFLNLVKINFLEFRFEKIPLPICNNSDENIGKPIKLSSRLKMHLEFLDFQEVHVHMLF